MKLVLFVAALLVSQFSFAQEKGGRYNGRPTVAQISLSAGQTVELMPYQRTEVSCANSQSNRPPSDPAQICSMSGAGQFNYSSYNYILKQNSKAIHGSNNITDFLAHLDKLEDAGLCQSQFAACTLAGAGQFNYSSYNYRIAADNVIIFGSNNNDQLLEVMHALRAAGVCR